jgi:hypothetical protein
MVPIGYTAGAGEDGAVGLFTDIVIPEISIVGVPFGPWINRVVFIIGLPIQNRFCRFYVPVAVTRSQQATSCPLPWPD